MSTIFNWRLVTERDFLFAKYGYGMSTKNWNYYVGEGEEISKEQHLAFEVALATGKQFFPKQEYREAFVITGYAEKYGHSRLQQPVQHPNGKVGDIIITSCLAWAKKENDTIKICTKSNSVYVLKDMVREKDYLKPEDAGKTTDELNELVNKYFKFE